MIDIIFQRERTLDSSSGRDICFFLRWARRAILDEYFFLQSLTEHRKTCLYSETLLFLYFLLGLGAVSARDLWSLSFSVFNLSFSLCRSSFCFRSYLMFSSFSDTNWFANREKDVVASFWSWSRPALTVVLLLGKKSICGKVIIRWTFQNMILLYKSKLYQGIKQVQEKKENSTIRGLKAHRLGLWAIFILQKINNIIISEKKILLCFFHLFQVLKVMQRDIYAWLVFVFYVVDFIFLKLAYQIRSSEKTDGHHVISRLYNLKR